MRGRFQWKVTVHIKASPAHVWEIIDDISLIPQYHAEVGKVDLLSGQQKRAVGVKYRCNILEGRKGSCVEEVVEYIPNSKMSTGMSEDTWGMDRMFSNFIVDATVIPQPDRSTILQFEAYYDPMGLRNRVLNALMLQHIMRKRARLTMQGIKRLSEAR
jgi:hypothetical protein